MNSIFANLEPGDYLIQIDPKEEAAFVFPADASPKPAPNKCYGQSWYPDASSIDAAATIHLAEGESRRLDISLHSRETHSISGTLKAPRELAGQPLTLRITDHGSGRLGGNDAGARNVSHRQSGARQLPAGIDRRKASHRYGKLPRLCAFRAGHGQARWRSRRSTESATTCSRSPITILTISTLRCFPYAGVTGEVRMLEKDAKLPPEVGSDPDADRGLSSQP